MPVILSRLAAAIEMFDAIFFNVITRSPYCNTTVDVKDNFCSNPSTVEPVVASNPVATSSLGGIKFDCVGEVPAAISQFTMQKSPALIPATLTMWIFTVAAWVLVEAVYTAATKDPEALPVAVTTP